MDDELQGLTEFHPEVGGVYESKDAKGNWWDITITSQNANDTYCADVHDGHQTKWTKVHRSNIVEKPSEKDPATPVRIRIIYIILDIIIVSALVLVMFTDILMKADPLNPKSIVSIIPDTVQHIILGVFIASIALWRIRLCSGNGSQLPFSCVRMDVPSYALYGKEADVYLCGTMHVSPGSVTDTRSAITHLVPDVIMIELDIERLRDMKFSLGDHEETFQQELQVNDRVVSGIHADWNSFSKRGDFGPRRILFEEDNPFGGPSSTPLLEDVVYACKRGKHSFYAKTIFAEKRGATGVIVIDDPRYPQIGLLESGSLCASLKAFWETCTLRQPSIPCFLVKPEERLADGDTVDAFIKPEEIPKPYSFSKKLCRCVVMTGSGIGILYGVIRYAGVKVGQEFLTADIEATKLGKPLVCIDISVGNLGTRLRNELMPWPSNILKNIDFWLQFPRCIFNRVLFPRQGLDLPATMLWAFARFKIRTWLAFIVAAVLTSFILAIVLQIPGVVVEQATTATGQKEFGSAFAENFPWVLEVYIFPAIYRALLDQRDEEMYRAIASQVRRRKDKRTFVAVVGAAHINGILHRASVRGL